MFTRFLAVIPQRLIPEISCFSWGDRCFTSGESRRSGRRAVVLPNRLQFVVERTLVSISFTTSGFQVEHHVLHVHSQLAQRLLD